MLWQKKSSDPFFSLDAVDNHQDSRCWPPCKSRGRFDEPVAVLASWYLLGGWCGCVKRLTREQLALVRAVGARRCHAFVGVVMVVHAGFATLLAAAPRREGTLGKMRLSPIAKALQAKIAA